MPAPTPAGVPVRTSVPASRVVPRVISQSSSTTGASGLHDLAIEPRRDCEVGRIADLGGGNQRSDRAKGVEALAAAELAAASMLLPPASGDIVGGRVVRDRIERRWLIEISYIATDDQGEFAFPVHLRAMFLAHRRDDDVVAISDDRRGILEEDHRTFRPCIPELRGMIRVVASHTPDGGRATPAGHRSSAPTSEASRRALAASAAAA
jgi:hypothetical protein